MYERTPTPSWRLESPKSTPTRSRTRVDYADGIVRKRIQIGAVDVPTVQPTYAPTEWLAVAPQHSERVPDDDRPKRVAIAGNQPGAMPGVMLIQGSGNGLRRTQAGERDPTPSLKFNEVLEEFEGKRRS